jgi:hypothetical protein
MYSVQIQGQARKWRRSRERLSSPRTGGVRREEAADANERAERVLRNVWRWGLELARGRREGEGGRGLRSAAAPFRGARGDHDAWLEERDVPPGAARCWRRHDGLEEEDEEEGDDGED